MTSDVRTAVQTKAVNSAVKALKNADRGKVIMPCGTGKTRVGLQVMNKLGADLTLVLCPALSLVKQNLDCYLQNTRQKFAPLVVCSDDSTATEAREQYGISVATTTSPAEIRSAIRNRTGKLVIFGTYQSAEQIAQAFATKGLGKFDLIVFDEAHRTAGTDGVFSLALHDSNIPAKKRLYLTATPRTMRAALKQRAAEDGVEVICMDDESLYGKEVYRLEFARAVELGLLTDYHVVIFGVSASLASEWMQDYGGEAIVAARVGLIKAMEKYKIRKVISYHSSTAAARKLSGELANGELDLPHLFHEMRKRKQAAGKCWVRSIDGTTPVDQRNEIMREFASQPNTSRAVLSNCKVLTEGVDAPSVDAVAFMDPKSSVTDIVQAIGRSMRLCEGKHRSYVIVPVFIPDTQESVDDKPERWDTVLHVVRALKDHDSRIEAAVQAYKRAESDGESEPREKNSLLELLPQIELSGISAAWSGSLQPRLLGSAGRTFWTENDVRAEVDRYIQQNKCAPTCCSSKMFRTIDVWLTKHKGRSLAVWLGENGYSARRQPLPTDLEIHDMVESYIEVHENRPHGKSGGEWSRITQFMGRRGTTFGKWMDERGFPRAGRLTMETLQANVREHIELNGDISKATFPQWVAAESWLRRYHATTMSQWLYDHGYKVRMPRITDDYIKEQVRKYESENGRRPYCKSTLEFQRIDGRLRTTGSCLAKWLDANGYAK